MADAHGDLDDRMLHRMIFFTDAVFAIVLTILVLELKPPENAAAANLETLRHAIPHIGAFAFSFAIIGVFWISHMNTVRRLAVFDWPTAVANLVYLLPVSMLPYVTGWLGVDIGGTMTWVFYSTVLIAISACNAVLVLVAYRGGGRLIAGAATPRERAYRLIRALAPGAAFAAGLGVVAAGQPILAHFCWVLIPIAFRLAATLLEPAKAPVSDPEAEA